VADFCLSLCLVRGLDLQRAACYATWLVGATVLAPWVYQTSYQLRLIADF
jgi:hypothetical protein